MIYGVSVLLVLSAANPEGPDVSNYQKTVDWKKMVHDSDVKFAMAKATEGDSFVDAYFKASSCSSCALLSNINE